MESTSEERGEKKKGMEGAGVCVCVCVDVNVCDACLNVVSCGGCASCAM